MLEPGLTSHRRHSQSAFLGAQLSAERAACAIGLAAIMALLPAQLTAAQQTPVFRAQARLVPIYVTVTGPDGRLMTGLTREQFSVFEDDVSRPIEVFSTDPGPITGLAAWDVSREMRRDPDRSRASALSLIRAIWPEDRLRFGTFSAVEFSASPLLTGDQSILRRIVDEELWFVAAPSALWQSLEEALARLSRDQGRRVLITLGAGRSSWDSRSSEHVIAALHRVDAQVYAVGLERSGLSENLRRLAAETGGGHVLIGQSEDLDRVWSEILYELHHQYVLGFAPAAADGRRHEVRVSSTVSGARVRARRAHVAGASGEGR